MSDEAPSKPSGLREEIAQTKPFHSRSQEALLALMRTADDARRRYHDLFEGAGITFQQYNVLRILRGAGDGGLPTLTVAERMVERTPGVTRLIDRMERKGWVNRRRCLEDRRVVWCAITASGLELLDDLEEAVRIIDDTLFGVLTPLEVEELLGHLDRIREHLRRAGDG